MRGRACAAALLAVVLTACGGGGGKPTTAPVPSGPPDLAAFLRLPVATPASCPPNTNGTTSGRRSPWVGHVDISAFLRASVDARDVRVLQRQFTALPHVEHVYYESKAQAFAEFQRLYTCSLQVSRAAVPASFRIALLALTPTARDDLVRRMQAMPGVASVSCDPANPCVDVTPGP